MKAFLLLATTRPPTVKVTPLRVGSILMRWSALGIWTVFSVMGCILVVALSSEYPALKIPRSIQEGARDLAHDNAKTDAYQVSRRERKKVKMLFAYVKRVLKHGRLRLRGPNGARDEFRLAATAQNLR